jgi:hypothetical protein
MNLACVHIATSWTCSFVRMCARIGARGLLLNVDTRKAHTDTKIGACFQVDEEGSPRLIPVC